MIIDRVQPKKDVLPKTTSADVFRWFHEGKDAERWSITPVYRFISSACSERYFVTLTDQRKMSSGEFSRSVGWALHKTNEAFFGTAYRRRRAVFLASYAVQETTFREGLHTHLIIGVPDGALQLKPNKPITSAGEYLVEFWVQAEPRYRSRKAQDCRVANQLDGLFGYIHKTIRSPADFENVDVSNTTFPATYAVPKQG